MAARRRGFTRRNIKRDAAGKFARVAGAAYRGRKAAGRKARGGVNRGRRAVGSALIKAGGGRKNVGKYAKGDFRKAFSPLNQARKDLGLRPVNKANNARKRRKLRKAFGG